MAADRLIAALDVGTTKVCCFIGQPDHHGIRVRGIGHRISRGMREGAVVDMEETESAIRAAVDQAESAAGQPIDSVYVGLSAGDPVSRIAEMDVAIAGHEVDQADIDHVLAEAEHGIDEPDETVIHAFPACFAIDGAIGVKDPIGMFGEKLSVAVHVVTARPGPVRNLEACVARGHLGVADMVMSPYASGLSVLDGDEKKLGVACVDMGGGSTSVSIFIGDAMVYADIIPLGGCHLSEDIARELLTPIHHAERLKTLYGHAITSPSDDGEVIDVPRLGESEFGDDSLSRLPRSMLTNIIQPRLEETLEAVRSRLVESGFDRASGRGVVLTGGASLLPGLRELAQRVLGKRVRIGRPRGLTGLADSTGGPAFATCAGLLHYALNAPENIGAMRVSESRFAPAGRFARVGQWLRENF